MTLDELESSWSSVHPPNSADGISGRRVSRFSRNRRNGPAAAALLLGVGIGLSRRPRAFQKATPAAAVAPVSAQAPSLAVHDFWSRRRLVAQAMQINRQRNLQPAQQWSWSDLQRRMGAMQ